MNKTCNKFVADKQSNGHETLARQAYEESYMYTGRTAVFRHGTNRLP